MRGIPWVKISYHFIRDIVVSRPNVTVFLVSGRLQGWWFGHSMSALCSDPSSDFLGNKRLLKDRTCSSVLQCLAWHYKQKVLISCFFSKESTHFQWNIHLEDELILSFHQSWLWPKEWIVVLNAEKEWFKQTAGIPCTKPCWNEWEESQLFFGNP